MFLLVLAAMVTAAMFGVGVADVVSSTAHTLPAAAALLQHLLQAVGVEAVGELEQHGLTCSYLILMSPHNLIQAKAAQYLFITLKKAISNSVRSVRQELAPSISKQMMATSPLKSSISHDLM